MTTEMYYGLTMETIALVGSLSKEELQKFVELAEEHIERKELKRLKEKYE